ncbi:propionyl-CoA carboxylase [bacterium]|nr:propionyl-CoA carboxylase [bacterium]
MTITMENGVTRLREIREKNPLGGGQKHIDRQHDREKMTARERIDCLLDSGTFSELGSCVNTTAQRMDGKKSEAPCDGAIVGTGKVNGRRIAVYASDFTVLGGSIAAQHIQKCAELIIMAAEWGIPMVWLLDSSGGRLGHQDVMPAGIDWYFALMSRYSGVIPQINVLMGPCIAGQAYAPTLCDFLLMSRKTGNLWLGGPRQTQAATSEQFNKDVGSADYHMALSGTCDVVGDGDKETIILTRELLSYLPSNFKDSPPKKDPIDVPGKEVGELASLIPDDFNKVYDMHEVIKSLVDDGELYEIKKDYAKNIITCFCRFNGNVVGLVANNPQEPGSIMEIDSCDKYYRFLQALDAYNIPLVTLVDTPPEVAGEDQEAKGLLRHVGKLIATLVSSTIPKICVVLREAYSDSGSMLLGAVKGIGTDLCYTWPISQFAVEASTADYRKLYGKGIEDDAYEGYLNRSREKVGVFEIANTYTSQIVDEVIEPKDTRKKIIEALQITKNKSVKLPKRAKNHGTCPT